MADFPDPDFTDDLDDEPYCCDHEDYDVDILEGVARCWYCGHSWVQTDEDIAREIAAQSAYDEICLEWEKERQSLRYRFNSLIARLKLLWRKKGEPTDDEIPF